MKYTLTLFILLISLPDYAQTKKPLDHSVYDDWQSIGEKVISNNGKYLVYTINPQEGDGKLVIQKTTGEIVLEISRGYSFMYGLVYIHYKSLFLIKVCF
jgi:hypothetical protein